jgi:flagellar hook-length control protein FliK
VTPANVAPQGIVTVNTDGAAQPSGNVTITTSVHAATTGPDVVPNSDALAITIAARSLSGARQFEIRLDPPELGRVDVRLSIDDSGKAQAHLTADQPQTLNLLQKDAPTLTQALRNAGLDVSQSGLNFSLRGQDRQNSDKNSGANQGRRTNLTATRAITAAQGTTAVSFNGAAADARVDIHV